MTKRVLVTGAGGFIGRQAIAPLLERGFEVHAVSRQPGGERHACADLLDADATRAVLEQIRPTHLLHLAWDVTHGAFWESRSNLDWVAASLGLYRAFVAAGGKAMAVAGTCAEYDWSGSMLEEDTALRPATLYGVAKHGLHTILRSAAAKDGVSLAWGRIFLLYGPHEGPNRLVSGVARQLLRGEPALVGKGELYRDFMHVTDVAAALVMLLDLGVDEAVNIATGEQRSIGDVVTALGTATGRPDLVRIGARPSPPGEKALLAASGQRLRALGFTPRYGLSEGLAETVAWWASMSGE